MIKDGIGGNKTQTGLTFEKHQNIIDKIKDLEHYYTKLIEKNFWELFYKKEQIGFIFKKYKLYKFLEKKGIRWKNYISARLLPDSAIFIKSSNTLFVLEMKYQEGDGSVDEKLQTADFKKKQYQKLTQKLNWNIEFIFLLGDWFDKPKYKDVLEYIKSVNCSYFIKELPLNKIGLDLE